MDIYYKSYIQKYIVTIRYAKIGMLLDKMIFFWQETDSLHSQLWIFAPWSRYKTYGLFFRFCQLRILQGCKTLQVWKSDEGDMCRRHFVNYFSQHDLLKQQIAHRFCKNEFNIIKIVDEMKYLSKSNFRQQGSFFYFTKNWEEW